MWKIAEIICQQIVIDYFRSICAKLMQINLVEKYHILQARRPQYLKVENKYKIVKASAITK